MSEFAKRTIFGAIYVLCVVGSILWGPFMFSGLFFIICLLAVDEFHRLVKSQTTVRVYSALATVALWTMMQCLAWNTAEVGLSKSIAGAALFAYMVIIISALLDEIWNHSEQPLTNWGNFLVSQMMVAIPLASLSFIYFLDRWLLLALFVLIWVNDSGAYIVGSLTAKRPQGNHKMTPHISPKKSWEGLIGGFAFTMLAAIILHFCGWFKVITVGNWGIAIALVFAFLVSSFGTMGDLIESLLKRSLGVKDSGKFLPGHGGVLDRFDSILMAGPVLAFFCWLCYFAVPLL